ncbi:MAG TPA: DNA alkylation repair protein [Verrucomicrobiae bacterium]|jgi:3-methyladenine DNA glycosylase AlkD
MTAQEILEEIKPLGNEGYRKILANHGVTGPSYGVKVEHLKRIQKRVRMDHRLALDLYASGIYDAMYLAGLIADDARMTKADLQQWVENANAPLAGSTVAWVASGSPHAVEIALKWIDSPQELVAAAGWATLASLVSIKPDAELDLSQLKKLLERVQKTIHSAPNAARKQMNGFVIAVGTYVTPLSSIATQTGGKIGPVTVDVGNTACKVPFAPDYIEKAAKKGAIGKKRQTAKC